MENFDIFLDKMTLFLKKQTFYAYHVKYFTTIANSIQIIKKGSQIYGYETEDSDFDAFIILSFSRPVNKPSVITKVKKHLRTWKNIKIIHNIKDGIKIQFDENHFADLKFSIFAPPNFFIIPKCCQNPVASSLLNFGINIFLLPLNIMIFLLEQLRDTFFSPIMYKHWANENFQIQESKEKLLKKIVNENPFIIQMIKCLKKWRKENIPLKFQEKCSSFSFFMWVIYIHLFQKKNSKFDMLYELSIHQNGRKEREEWPEYVFNDLKLEVQKYPWRKKFEINNQFYAIIYRANQFEKGITLQIWKRSSFYFFDKMVDINEASLPEIAIWKAKEYVSKQKEKLNSFIFLLLVGYTRKNLKDHTRHSIFQQRQQNL